MRSFSTAEKREKVGPEIESLRVWDFRSASCSGVSPGIGERGSSGSASTEGVAAVAGAVVEAS